MNKTINYVGTMNKTINYIGINYIGTKILYDTIERLLRILIISSNYSKIPFSLSQIK